MKLAEALEKYTILALVFLFPLLVLSLFQSQFDTPKMLILILGISIALLIKAVKTVVKGSFDYSLGSFDIPVLILALSYLLSAAIKSPNKMDAFFLPGTATVILGAAILYFFINSLGEKEKGNVASTLFFSGVTASLVSLLAFSGILAKIPQLPAFVKDVNFTTLGGSLPLATYLGITSVIGLGIALSEKELVKKTFFGVSLVIALLGFTLAVYNCLPGKTTSPVLPPFNATWSVAVETLKVSPLLGVGPGNYLTAFNRFRPVSYNATKLWAIRFTTGADMPLTVLTEAGLFGLAGFALLLFVAFKLIRKEIKESPFYLVALGLTFLVTLLLPVSSAFVVLLFAVLSLNSKLKPQDIRVTAPEANKLPAYLVAIPLLVAAGALIFFGYKAFAAEATFKKGLDALVKNDGVKTYDLLRKATAANPYVDRYHATYAQVNLALASSLATKKDLSDTDKQTISQLIQQAIREGKATVTLNQQRAGNWEILARIYQSIMPFAQGADNFTIQTFTQAVALDPINPNLRIALGGVYYALGRYDEAISVFQVATLAKSDLANAHYNLAIALREKGEIEKAITEMETVVSLVSKDSSDYQLAKTELDNLEKKRPAKVTEGSETLTPPAPSPTPAIKPPLTLPEESTPPATTQ